MLEFTATQLVAHILGDYVFQSHWMATKKTDSNRASLFHVLAYGLPFIFLIGDFTVGMYLVITLTHFFIDRFRLARYLVFAKNLLAPKEFRPRWEDCDGTGFPKETPDFLSVWLMIIVDNILHVVINAVAIQYL